MSAAYAISPDATVIAKEMKNMGIIRRDILNKRIKEKDPRGRKEGDLQWEDEMPIIIAALESNPNNVKYLWEKTNKAMSAAGFPEIKSWHTMKKYLKKLHAEGLIQAHTVGRSTCYYRR